MYLFILLLLLLHPLMTGLFTQGILLEEIVGLGERRLVNQNVSGIAVFCVCGR